MTQDQIEDAILNSELEDEYEDKTTLMWRLKVIEMIEEEYSLYDNEEDV